GHDRRGRARGRRDAGAALPARGPAALAAAPRLAVGREARRMSAGTVVLLSGGLDSATALAWARARGFDCTTLAVDYGQRHRGELAGARRIGSALGARDHREVAVDLRAIGGSALTADLAVPKGREVAQMSSGTIPITYVPARNSVFLSLALGLAETI